MGFPNQKRCNVNVYVADIFFSLCLGKYFSLPREKLWCAKKSSALYVILCRGICFCYLITFEVTDCPLAIRSTRILTPR